jgi:hypothetical protein
MARAAAVSCPARPLETLSFKLMPNINFKAYLIVL